MIVLRIATGIRSHFVTRLPEWICASELMAEGVQLLRSDVFASQRVYRSIHLLVGNEERWGMVGASLAMVWLTALFLNGTFLWFRRISPWVRSISAFLASAYWVIWSVAMLYGNPAGTGGLNHAGFAALAAAYSILTAREVGMAERDAKQCQPKRSR